MNTFSSQFRVLLVEDDENDRLLLTKTLAKEGIHADMVIDGVEALNRLEQGQAYDLVVTDLRMPRKHGHSLIIEILREYPQLPIIVVTGLVETKIFRDLFARGVTDVMLKSDDFEMLAIRIKAILERGPEAPDSEAVAEQIERVTNELEAQMEQVAHGFENTIATLRSSRKKLQKGYLGSVRVFANLITRTDGQNGSHAARVEEFAKRIALEKQLESDLAFEIQLAALLHEVGQFSMPDTMRTNPPSTLTGKQKDVYEQYPLLGAALISEISDGERIAEYIEAHAENFDGSGFPSGRRGEDIPLGARVVRLADGIDTLRMHASESIGSDAVGEHLQEQRGHAYDPDLVDVAVTLIDDFVKRKPDRSVRLHELVEGLVVAEDVKDREGHFLVRTGATLTPSMIERLRRILQDRTIRVFH